MSQKSYKDLIAWQKGMALVTAIYDATEGFPSHKRFGLISQLRRAAVSVPSNNAEGEEHYSNRDFVRFLRHARGSLGEIETQVLISERRTYGHRNHDEVDSEHRRTGAHLERVN